MSYTENTLYNTESISNYLATHKFEPHAMGNYGKYGLNLIGCDSIISCLGDIWKFYAFKTGSNDAIYVNKNGTILIMDPSEVDYTITRLQEKIK